ncbi:MAG: ASCH domain-containing protein [Kofleriaceae bacterium]
MLLFKKAFFAGLLDGSITLTYRRWQQPHVRPGGRYRCHPIGVLEVDRIELVTVATIRDADAVAAGFATRAALVAYLAELGPLEAATEVYRVELHHGGDGDRVELALHDQLAAGDLAAIRARLDRLDRDEAWTRKTLAIIAKRPRIAASQLAKQLGRETLPFKVDVRKLKKLGLTQSFEVGYELSPRGRAYLAGSARRPRAKPATAGRRTSPVRAPERKGGTVPAVPGAHGETNHGARTKSTRRPG